MTMWRQFRSYLSWPTEALLVGPDASSSWKWLAWGGSFVLGLGLSLVACGTVGRAFFVMSSRDSIWSITVVGAALLFLPLVLAGLVLPRLGGPLLVFLSVAVTLSSLPATQMNVGAAVWVLVVLAVPMFVVGSGFAWSGLRPVERRPKNAAA